MKQLARDKFISLIEGKIIGVKPVTGVGVRVSPNRAVAWFNETVANGYVGYVGVSENFVWIGASMWEMDEMYQVGDSNE